MVVGVRDVDQLSVARDTDTRGVVEACIGCGSIRKTWGSKADAALVALTLAV